MALLGKWSANTITVGNAPETWSTAPAIFGTEDRNDSSTYTLSSTGLLTLPSSGLADGYLMVAAAEFSDDGARYNPQLRITQASGTGTFAGGPTGGYLRDPSEDRAYVRCFAFVDNPSASSTYQTQWKADTDDADAADTTIRSEFQVIPLFYNDVAVYTSTSAALYGGTTPNQVTGWSGTDGTNITLSSNVITCAADNARYLILGSQFFEGRGGRTQRWHGLEIDNVQENAAKAYSYYRNTSNDESGDIFTWLLETVTANVTLEQTCYRGDGVSALQGGADIDGSTPAVGDHVMVVLELNSSAEVFRSQSSTNSSNLATSPTDLNVNETTDFNDTASFTDVANTSINCVQTADYLFGANISAASNAVANTTRWTAYAEYHVNGTEDTDSFAGDYLRNNQSSQDTFGWSANLLGFQGLTAGDDVGVSVTERAGTENGGAAVSPAGWTGFWGINLDTLSASADTNVNASTDALTLTTHQATVQLAPRVYLNTSETLIGATEMTVTSFNAAGTSITFTDPVGSPTGSVFLGVENTSTGLVGWIAVTVNTGDTTVNANTDALTLTENQATITYDVDVLANTDALTLTENQASITLDTNVLASTDALILTENTATITYDVEVLAGVDPLVLTEQQASISVDINVAATTDALTLTTFPASLSADTIVTANVDALTLTENQATITYDVNVLAGTDALVLAENQSTISLDIDIQATTDALVLTEFPATITRDINVLATTDALTLTEFQAIVVAGDDTNVAANVDALTLTEQQASISVDVEVITALESLTLTEFPAAISLDVDIQATTDALVLTEFPATIEADVDTNVLAGTHDLVLTEFQAFIDGILAGAVPKPSGGLSRKSRKRRYLVEIDGEFFDADSVIDVQSLLAQAEETAKESAQRDVINAPDVRKIRIKPPKVRVQTVSGKPTNSVTIQRDVAKTQRRINAIYLKAQKEIEQIREISSLMRVKIAAEEDEEETIIALLL